jgi:hypothetical protein
MYQYQYQEQTSAISHYYQLRTAHKHIMMPYGNCFDEISCPLYFTRNLFSDLFVYPKWWERPSSSTLPQTQTQKRPKHYFSLIRIPKFWQTFAPNIDWFKVRLKVYGSPSLASFPKRLKATSSRAHFRYYQHQDMNTFSGFFTSFHFSPVQFSSVELNWI